MSLTECSFEIFLAYTLKNGPMLKFRQCQWCQSGIPSFTQYYDNKISSSPYFCILRRLISLLIQAESQRPSNLVASCRVAVPLDVRQRWGAKLMPLLKVKRKCVAELKEGTRKLRRKCKWAAMEKNPSAFGYVINVAVLSNKSLLYMAILRSPKMLIYFLIHFYSASFSY